MGNTYYCCIFAIKIIMRIDQLLLGSMLGDGCISTKGLSKHHRFSLAHSEKQLEYITFKHEIFKQYKLDNKLSYYIIKNERYKNGEFREFRFKTKGHKIFDKYRMLFYPEGKKIVPDRINKLEAEGLAIWFMDDGYRTGNNLKGAMFSTSGFSKEDVIKLKDLLENKFKLKCSIHARNEIYIWVQSVPRLIELISPFIVPSMKYKVLNKSDELQESTGEPICSQVLGTPKKGSTTTGGVQSP